MKNYNTFILEDMNIDIDTYMLLLKQTKSSDPELFKKLINDNKERLFSNLLNSKNIEYLDFVIEYIDDINFLDNNRTLLYKCKTEKCINYFLDKGVDPTIGNVALISHLYKFTSIRNFKTYQRLIGLGANLDNDLLGETLTDFESFLFFLNNGLKITNKVKNDFFSTIRSSPYMTKSELLNLIKIIDYFKKNNLILDKKTSLSFDNVSKHKIKIILPHIYDFLILEQIFSSSYDGIIQYFENIDYLLTLTNSYSLYLNISELKGSRIFRQQLEKVLIKHKKLDKRGKFNL